MNKGRISTWESHLTERAAAGDEAAFELLSDLYRPMLMSLALRLLRNPEDANDAVQDTMLKAYRAIREFDSDRPLKPWLCRICANCCVDSVRSRKRDGSCLEDQEHVPQGGQGVDEQATGNIRQRQVIDAISRLPEKYRRIILMRHFRHMDVNEIAIELDTPEGTIKSWLFRARALLKKDLHPALG
ncbi:MAG TPA: sigma-70 family RNA polymerase sigma factor [Fimbriimonas sp.]|nr:sigma-70 family RNA polymerase sigma factor [Fimbriimonas sp.]